jgi:ABC-type multidrug transport system fused ATPase/permease subunit
MDANDDEITKAARTANVHSFISKFPNEYLTEVCMLSVEMQKTRGNSYIRRRLIQYLEKKPLPTILIRTGKGR